ncbi:hypothetical protein DFH06DRAFT_1471111 [Mycena polygramma]|nr:hypothetical protein DFH06DRAFT_1471111 [Mycena polygramma]
MRYTGKEDVEFIFDYCPPPIRCSRNHTTPIPDKRLSFHDRHIDERLLLRRVLPLSSLPQTLADVADEALNNVLTSGLSIPDNAEATAVDFDEARSHAAYTSTEAVAGSYGVSRHFQMTALDFFHPIASLLLMRPLNFLSIFRWGNREREEHWEPLAHGPQFVLDGNALTIQRMRSELLIVEQVFRDYDAETQDHLLGVVKHCPVLGTWQIYPPSPEGDQVLEDMGRSLSLSSFTPGLCSTTGFRPSNPRCFPSHDAIHVPWTAPPLTQPQNLDLSACLSVLRGQPLAPRRSARLKSLPAAKTARKGKPARTRNTVALRAEETRITPAISFLRAPDRSTEDFLQHGWSEAVIEDSTFIIFTNGIRERIGIRHRGTQTLFLSDVMYVPACDPPYGRVHIGLYISAYRDAVDRYLQVRDVGEKAIAEGSHRVTRGSAAKRGTPEIDQIQGPSRKRQKTENTPSSSIERLFAEASPRNLLLVRLVYGIYNSVTPASFARSGPSLFPNIRRRPPRRTKASYGPTEYGTLTLGPELSSGATGVIHEAVIEVQTKDEQLLTGNVVVKLALCLDQQERLQHEFSVYERLAAAKVAGVPKILGVFEDIEGTATIMVMNHCGRSLAQTHLLEDKTNVHVSAAEKAAFLAVLDDIHKAGVRHRDMRPPNLLLNDDGEAAIIDFDQAELDPPEIGLKRELFRLTQLLEGNFTDADSVRTP